MLGAPRTIRERSHWRTISGPTSARSRQDRTPWATRLTVVHRREGDCFVAAKSLRWISRKGRQGPLAWTGSCRWPAHTPIRRDLQPLDTATTAAPQTAVIRARAGCEARWQLVGNQRENARRQRPTADAAPQPLNETATAAERPSEPPAPRRGTPWTALGCTTLAACGPR